MQKLLQLGCKASNFVTTTMDWAANLFVLGVRLYIVQIFMRSGLNKLSNWESTLTLFQNEYKIVGMSPEFAAYLGTTAEIGLPLLLLIGFGARVPAILLFIFNIFNVIFYPVLLTPEMACALKDHYLWGVLIAIIIFYGHGKISLDYWLKKKVCSEYKI